MGDLPAGLEARPLQADDVDEVFSLLAAGQAALHGEADITRADILSDWSRPSIDLARDAILVRDPDGAVAFAHVDQGRINAGVHPRAQGRGIGRWVVDWGVEHARASGESRAGITAADADLRLRSILERRGFSPAWESWLFWQALSADSPAPAPDQPARRGTPPAGLRLRRFDPQADAVKAHDVINVAFTEWSGQNATSFEDWRQAHIQHEEFEPRTSWVIEEADTGDIVGAALSMTDRGWGWLDELAVRHDRRSRGLGSMLLQQCLVSYRELGLHTGGLATDSRTGARDLYERNGFVVQRSFTRWSLELA